MSKAASTNPLKMNFCTDRIICHWRCTQNELSPCLSISLLLRSDKQAFTCRTHTQKTVLM